MKLLCTLFCLGFAVMSASASDVEQKRAEETGKTYKVFKTRLGWMYQNVTVTNINDAGISIIHSEGTARLGFDRLTPEQRETFGITRQGEKAMHAEEYQNKAAHEARIADKRIKWLEEQAERQQAYEEQRIAQQKAQQKAQQELLAKQAAARKVTQPVQQPQNETSIVSVLEVPTFPIIRGANGELLRPMQGYTRSYRRNHYGSNHTTIYTGGYGGSYGGTYGGTYGTPVRYSNGCYRSGGSTYRPSYRRGSYGSINYNGGNWNVGIRW